MAVAYARGILGIFAFDQEGRVIDFEAFPREAGTVAQRLLEEAPAEIEVLVGRLGSGELRKEQSLMVSHLDEVLEAASTSLDEYRHLAREVSFEMVESSLRALPRDQLAVQAVEAMDDVEEALNLLSERYREWWGGCYPQGSPAAGLADADTEIIDACGDQLTALKNLKKDLDGYLSSVLQGIAPNLTAILGAGLAAKLLSLAGGLERLASMPASKIQVLGAERALFKHLKDKTPPPKHGAIFQFPALKGAPWWQRGKIARALANKAAVAARADAFSGDYIAEELKGQFERRVEEIRKAHPDEPKRMRIVRTRPRGKGRGKKRRKKG